jgi:hypothetical protein
VAFSSLRREREVIEKRVLWFLETGFFTAAPKKVGGYQGVAGKLTISKKTV